MSKVRITNRQAVNAFAGDKASEEAFREKLKNRMLAYYACVEHAYYKVIDYKAEIPEDVLSHLEDADRYIVCAGESCVSFSGYDEERTLDLFSRLSHVHDKRIVSFFKSMMKTASNAGCQHAELITWIDVVSNLYRGMVAQFFSSVISLGYGNYYDSAYQESLRHVERAVKHLEVIQQSLEKTGLKVKPSDDTKEKMSKLMSEIIDTNIILRAMKYVDRHS